MNGKLTTYEWVVERLRKDGMPYKRRRFLLGHGELCERWSGLQYAARYTAAEAREEARELAVKGFVVAAKKVKISEEVE